MAGIVMMSATPSPSSSSAAAIPSSGTLPVRTIPGSYGLPLVGPLSDRLDYFWFQGPESFFKKRMEKHKSSVFRTNIPPSFPFFTANPNVVAVLDTRSFAHLFDMDVVEKRDVLVGDFMPSVNFTGGIRVGAYLDTSEPKHAKVKNFAMDVLKRSSRVWVQELTSSLSTMWDTIEADLSKNSSSVIYFGTLQKFIFNFLTKCLIGADPSASPEIADSGPAVIDFWLGLQLLPTIKIGFIQPLEEILLHSFSYPSFLVSGGYNKLYKFILENGKEVVKIGQTEFGLSQEETIHNLLFILGFNAYGGFSIFLPTLFGIIFADAALQKRLVDEVRALGGSPLTFDSLKELHLVQSVVYETLRLNPPVPLQFGRARRDFRLSSHDSAFDVKKGELLCGYQPLVMKDPRVFSEPESFDPDRFKDDKGLLDYLYWSNGPQTGSPAQSNKQCAAKDYVTMTACLIVADTFRRYDSITGSAGSITAVEKAK